LSADDWPNGLALVQLAPSLPELSYAASSLMLGESWWSSSALLISVRCSHENPFCFLHSAFYNLQSLNILLYHQSASS
jgi:hypothetical protein